MNIQDIMNAWKSGDLQTIYEGGGVLRPIFEELIRLDEKVEGMEAHIAYLLDREKQGLDVDFINHHVTERPPILLKDIPIVAYIIKNGLGYGINW